MNLRFSTSFLSPGCKFSSVTSKLLSALEALITLFLLVLVSCAELETVGLCPGLDLLRYVQQLPHALVELRFQFVLVR